MSANQDSVFHDSRPAMGTMIEVFLVAENATRAAELFEEAFLEIEYVEATLSRYRPTSEVSRINTTAHEEPVTVDPELFGILRRAREYGRISDGAFDITVGPLVSAWGFYGGTGRMPSRRALSRAMARSGWALLDLNADLRTVRFLDDGVEIDLGAIGKGWALDRAATVLRRLGVANALLGAGASSFLAIGTPPGQAGWAVHVTDPIDAEQVLSTVLLRDRALATSGANQKFFEVDGRRYSHIIDPRTGAPVEGTLQVTVMAETAMDSDALSTALFVLGPEGAAGMLEAEKKRGALFVLDAPEARRMVEVHWPNDY
jgi:thiamine biosynthesis lipoprotein